MRESKEIKAHIPDSSGIKPIKKNLEMADLIGIVCSISTVFIFLFLMDRNTFVRYPLIFGDGGLNNLNSSFLSLFSNVNPWLDSIYILTFQNFRSEFGSIYNGIGIIPMLIMTVSMYFLLRKLGMSLPSRIAGSILYVINPTILVWGGFEYGGPLLFLPIISLFVILYYEENKLSYLIYAGVFILLFETINGVADTKFLIPFLILFVVFLLFKAIEERRFRVLLDILLWAIFTVIVSIPLLINIGGAYAIYSNAFTHSSNLYNIEIGIVKYVFQSSNLQNSFMGLNSYPGTYVYASGFTKSWSQFVWLLIVGSSIFSVFLYKGKYKLFYLLLLVLVAFMIIFQYGVYLGSFLWAYHYSFVVIYNYPLFFDEMQMFIYAIFFAWFIQIILNTYGSINIKKLGNIHFFSIHRDKIIVVIAVSALLVASFPIVNSSNGNGTIEINPSTYEMPSYWYNITSDLNSYQNYKVLVLPNNDTTLIYLDGAIPYSNVYGLPYNYQAFPQEFPNITVFQQLAMSFMDKNSQEVAKLLLDQNIGLIVILNINKNAKIEYSSTTISGGGSNFARIINSTGVYKIINQASNFIIYKYNGNAPKNNITSPSTLDLTNSFENLSKESKGITITTGDYSHLVIPIIFSSNGGLQKNYQQKLFISRNLSSSINQNFTNIYFAYSNGTFIPAWIQSINNTGASIWLKMLSGEKKVFLWIFPKYYNMLSSQGFLGEAPQLSSVYGQYDNGNLVFPFYDNFISPSSIASNFYSFGESNCIINDGLYLGSGGELISRAQLQNGSVFGIIDYKSSTSFGSGGANVGHGIYLNNNLSNNYEGFIYNTYSNTMELYTYFNNSVDRNFSYNTLYNFNMVVNGIHGDLSLGNFSEVVELYHNLSFHIALVNQPARSNNGSIYFQYIAMTNFAEARNYTFGREFVQQAMFNKIPIANPSDVGVTVRFIAFQPCSQGDWNYTWLVEHKTIYGNTANFTFEDPGMYNIKLIASNPVIEKKITIEYNETVKQRMTLSVNYTINDKYIYNFHAIVNNGTKNYVYYWYVDGVLVKEGNNNNLPYTLSYGGNHTILLYVIDSAGGISTYRTYINAPLTSSNDQRINVLMIIYNVLIFPLAIFFFIGNKNFRNWFNRLMHILNGKK